MSAPPSNSLPEPPALWRSLAAYERRGAAPSGRTDEFAAGAEAWPPAVDRRDFLRLMGASLALTGLSGCGGSSPPSIVPRAEAPEATAGDAPLFATACSAEGYARGILVTASRGRPTKIEGNPDHPESGGATDVFTQAAILSLYDPDRTRAPRRSGQPATWAAFENEWAARRADLAAKRGAGLLLLTEPTTSPTVVREIHRVLDALPEARWFQHTPLARYDHRGVEADYDFAAARVILGIESDCFYRHPAAVRYGRALARARRTEEGRADPPRFYAIEATPSVSGALADFRLPSNPDRLRRLLDAVAQTLGGRVRPEELSAEEASFARALVADIRAHPGRVACIAGPECAPEIRDWALAMSQQHGAEVTGLHAPQRSDADPRCGGDLAAFGAALAEGKGQVVFLGGGNPVYTAPPQLKLAERLGRAAWVAHLGETFDETAAVAVWHLPETHFLETWSDLRAYGGVAAIQQPLIDPLYDARSLVEVLRLLSAGPVDGAYEIVRATWREQGTDGNFEARWHDWLNRGIVDAAVPTTKVDWPRRGFPRLAREAAGGSFTLLLQPDPNILDGRHANNAWLQELPRPLTSLVWDNVALLARTSATELGVVNGDVVSVSVGDQKVEAPVWIMPGQSPATIALTLGYGRSRAGSVGNGVGYDAYAVRTPTELWQRAGVKVRKTGRRHPLVSTQEHFALEGRDLIRITEPSSVARTPAPAEPAASLFATWPRGSHAWGMSIDLGTCLGCNACVIACQAENNIPVVGREQVARGREMHWIRLDRYFSGEPDRPRFLHQPVPCMQCENAPCELVCPVGATVHSSEGLNDMVYNRCVGTRYCSNNCPYKVRRFNFLDYRAPRESPVELQANPYVTVRERGVMEKCTYCVQRINAGRSAAERTGRPLADGAVRTACQQACPAEAIVFGDLNDPASRVNRRKAEPGDYALLGELNTKPRTTYLPVVRHPEPA